MKAELTKGDIYVVVDTPKKAKRLKNLLDMFKEPMFTIPNNEWSSHNGIDYGWGYGFSNELWQGFNTKSIAHNGKEFKKVSIKELRNILARENLRSGDYVFCENKGCSALGTFKKCSHKFGFDLDKFYWSEGEYRGYINTTGCFENFKRYATPEEIALLEPKKFDKFAELKEAHKNGKSIECRLRYSDCTWIEKTHQGFLNKFEYRIKPEEPVKSGDWMFNPNSKKIAKVKKENHGKSLIGSGWVKIKDTELVEKLNSL